MPALQDSAQRARLAGAAARLCQKTAIRQPRWLRSFQGTCAGQWSFLEVPSSCLKTEGLVDYALSSHSYHRRRPHAGRYKGSPVSAEGLFFRRVEVRRDSTVFDSLFCIGDVQVSRTCDAAVIFCRIHASMSFLSRDCSNKDSSRSRSARPRLDAQSECKVNLARTKIVHAKSSIARLVLSCLRRADSRCWH